MQVIVHSTHCTCTHKLRESCCRLSERLCCALSRWTVVLVALSHYLGTTRLELLEKLRTNDVERERGHTWVK